MAAPLSLMTKIDNRAGAKQQQSRDPGKRRKAGRSIRRSRLKGDRRRQRCDSAGGRTCRVRGLAGRRWRRVRPTCYLRGSRDRPAFGRTRPLRCRQRPHACRRIRSTGGLFTDWCGLRLRDGLGRPRHPAFEAEVRQFARPDIVGGGRRRGGRSGIVLGSERSPGEHHARRPNTPHQSLDPARQIPNPYSNTAAAFGRLRPRLQGQAASTSTSSASSSASMRKAVSPVMAMPSRGPAATPFTRTRPPGTM